MQLMHPALSTNGKGKRKLNAKQRRALEEHNKYLLSKGLHTSQIKKSSAHKQLPVETNPIRRPVIRTSDQVGNGFVKNIFEATRGEDPAVIREIQHKAKRVAPIWSKGSLQYITDATSLEDVGRKK